MSLAPTCQIHQTAFLESFQSSLSKFHGYRLFLIGQSSSNLLKKHHFCSSNAPLSTNALYDDNPTRKSNFPIERHRSAFSCPSETPISQSHRVRSVSGGSWIDKWKETRPLNLPKKPKATVDYRNGALSSEDDDERCSGDSGNVRSSSTTMDRIVEKLKRFGYVDDMIERKERLPEKGSVEDIFYVEDGNLPNSRGGFSGESQLGMELNGLGDGEVRFPWEKSKEKEQEMDRDLMRKRLRSKTAMAELTLPESELRRLRDSAFRMKSRMKIGGSGVTQAVVDALHEKWKTAEVVRLKFQGGPALNMRRTQEILERKTGGLVIWRSGTSVCLYRGVGYEVTPMQSKKQLSSGPKIGPNSFGTNHMIPDKAVEDSTENPSAGVSSTNSAKVEKNDKPEIVYENEIDKLLDGLGPRYSDWPGGDPLPVDADLLPGVVPGYKEPFRLLPYGVRSVLGNKDMIGLRRLARVLPPHFALGRSREHQGLAVAIAKLWEKSSIAKIALKRGVQLTSSERMAEDIKELTGGTILIINKEYIVLYRGKDFLSPEVAEALLERKRLAQALQDEEELARLWASSLVIPNLEKSEQTKIAGTAVAGTLGETREADARWGKRLDDDHRYKMMRAAEAARHADLVRKLENRLSLAERKLMRAEKALAKVEAFLKPVDRSTNPESITDEERFMFRKLGLRMKAFLLLGRREVFDGTVENMHLHWKHRELVKIIAKVKSFERVKNIALSLESESGGVLVSVDKIAKGYAIILYRGKDYMRPRILRPKNLLTKRKALARSIELQRREAIRKHVAALNRSVEKLRSELDQMESVKDEGDEELYSKLDSAYPAEDEESEDEGEEAYLETYSGGDSDVDGDGSDSAEGGDGGYSGEEDDNDIDAVDTVHSSQATFNEQQNNSEDSDDDAAQLEIEELSVYSVNPSGRSPIL